MKKSLTFGFLIAVILLSFCSCTGNDSTSEITNSKDLQVVNTQTVEYKTNDDLFSNIGLTYLEIQKKYGQLVKIVDVEYQMFGYEFENGYGSYSWNYSDIPNIESMKIDDKNNMIIENAPVPSENKPCSCIENIKVEKLFLNNTLPKSKNDIKKIPGVSNVIYKTTSETGYADYCEIDFNYKGLECIIYTYKNEISNPNSYAIVCKEE